MGAGSLMFSTLRQGLAAERPVGFPGDYPVAFFYATDDNGLAFAYKPASGSTPNWRGLGNAPVNLGDENATLDPANSGRPHIVANVSADRTFTLPAIADSVGATFDLIASVGAADGHDWIITTPDVNELFAGGVLAVDTDGAPAVASAVVADQSDDDAFQVNVPQGGTYVSFYNDGTKWVVSGTVCATAVPVFS